MYLQDENQLNWKTLAYRTIKLSKMDIKQLLNDSTALENPLHSVKTCDKLYKVNKMKKEDAYLYNDIKSTTCVNPTW